jgi:hypothetical protein
MITGVRRHITRDPHRDSSFVIGDEMSYLPGYDSVAMALFSRHHDPVDAILAHHGLQGPWQQLPATGIANRIYATDDLVLRIAVEGQEALDDARTESVAAPVARAAGVCVPRLVAFDDSGTVVARPYSLSERVHGETLGLFTPEPHSCPATWQAVGRQLALLHNLVQDCCAIESSIGSEQHSGSGVTPVIASLKRIEGAQDPVRSRTRQLEYRPISGSASRGCTIKVPRLIDGQAGVRFASISLTGEGVQHLNGLRVRRLQGDGGQGAKQRERDRCSPPATAKK